MTDVCAFIFARGGSKGVPGKNLRVVSGKSLLARSIDAAQQVVALEKVFVSTDDNVIASEAAQLGAQVVRRGPELSGDNSPEWAAWQHGISSVREMGVACEVMVSVPTTAPLRAVGDVRRCLEALDDSVDCVVTITPSSHHPEFNMVTQSEQGIVRPGGSGAGAVSRRQDVSPLYNLTTVAYAAFADFVLEHDTMWEGRVRGVEIPAERALDIDSEWDLFIANLVLRERQSDA